MSVATTCVHEVLRFLQLHLAKAIKGCPINGAFARNTLGFAGLREKREFDCESYDFGQAGDGPLRSPFPDAQLRRYVRPGAALCPQICNPIDIRHDFRPAWTLALGAGIS